MQPAAQGHDRRDELGDILRDAIQHGFAMLTVDRAGVYQRRAQFTPSFQTGAMALHRLSPSQRRYGEVTFACDVGIRKFASYVF